MTAVAASEEPIDDELHTLHVRCGSDIQASLQAAGFRGDFQSQITLFRQVITTLSGWAASVRTFMRMYMAGSDRLISAPPRCDRCDEPAVVGYFEHMLCGRCFHGETAKREDAQVLTKIQQLTPENATRLLAHIVYLLDGKPRDAPTSA